MGLFLSLAAIPYMAVFFSSWIVASLYKPITTISLLCLLAQPSKSLYKLRLFGLTFLYLALCSDKKWTKPPALPASFIAKHAANAERKKIIFVRHGESTWNDTFNKGDRSRLSFALFFIPNLIYAMLCEFYWFVAGHMEESWFFDSPLSMKGVRQATDLREFLRKAEKGNATTCTPAKREIIDLMTGKTKRMKGGDSAGEATSEEEEAKSSPAAQLCSSNLRRAISTVALGFQDRLDQQMDDDSILILPQLQEISKNPDALSITPPRGEVVPSWIDKEIDGFDYKRIFHSQVSTKLHDGNKPLNTNGLKRMKEFCNVAFDQIEKDSIILGGHSLWFRSFFRTYMPEDVDHVSKRKKLCNGGCAGFTLLKISTDSGDQFMIDPTSICVVHGGFW